MSQRSNASKPAEGAAEELLGGKIRESVGKSIDNQQMQAESKTKKLQGQCRQESAKAAEHDGRRRKRYAVAEREMGVAVCKAKWASQRLRVSTALQKFGSALKRATLSPRGTVGAYGALMPGATFIPHSRATCVLGWTWAVIRLGRPQFLVGGFASFGLGAVMAHAMGSSLSWPRYFAGQAVVTSVQLMTHYANDYFDFEADVANCSPTRWSGGSRVLPTRQVSRSVALYAALACAGCAVAGMLAVHSLGAGVTVWSLMLAMLLLAWSYSAPPMRLNSRGWGEFVAAVVVAALVPFLGFAAQVGSVTTLALLAVLPLVLIQFVMLLVLDVPDRRGDATVGKSTLVVRIGVDSAGLLHNVALLGAYAVLPVLLGFGLPRSVVLVFACTAPLALFQVFAVARGRLHDPRKWEILALCAVALVVVGTVAELVGFAVMSTQPRSSILMTRVIRDARWPSASDTGGSDVFGGKQLRQ